MSTRASASTTRLSMARATSTPSVDDTEASQEPSQTPPNNTSSTGRPNDGPTVEGTGWEGGPRQRQHREGHGQAFGYHIINYAHNRITTERVGANG